MMTTRFNVPIYIYYSLAFLWLYSGVIPILFAQDLSLEMLTNMGVSKGFDWLLLIAASLLDIIYAVSIISAFRQRLWFRWVWLAQFLTVAFYSILVGVFLPENWIHPFAPLIKNVPIMALLVWLWSFPSNKLKGYPINDG